MFFIQNHEILAFQSLSFLLIGWIEHCFDVAEYSQGNPHVDVVVVVDVDVDVDVGVGAVVELVYLEIINLDITRVNF